MSTSIHASNRTKDFLVLGRGLIQVIEKTAIYAEKMYSPNFSAENKIFALSLLYNGDNSFLFVNGQKVTQFKAKDSKYNQQLWVDPRNSNYKLLTLQALITIYHQKILMIQNCMEMFMTFL